MEIIIAEYFTKHNKYKKSEKSIYKIYKYICYKYNMFND